MASTRGFYRIDVPVYHWDDDYYKTDIRTLGTMSLDTAKEWQSQLRSLEFKERDWSNMARHPLERENELADVLDIHLGGIFESNFNIYTETVTRKIIE